MTAPRTSRRARSLAPPLLALAALSLAACGVTGGRGGDLQRGGASPLIYPDTARVEHVDDYQGEQVPDPYRWLEDPDAPETRAWVETQNELTFGYLDTIPERETIRERLEALWNYERYGMPEVHGERVFFVRNDGLQDQSVLYVADGLEGEPRVLIDPNTFSEDGTVSLAGWVPTDDGSRVAYALADGGSDWRTYHVRDVTTGEDLPDVVPWVKFSGASWDAEDKGFFYTRYEPPENTEDSSRLSDRSRGPQVRYHALGTDAAEDVVIYERPDQPDWLLGGRVTDDGRWLVLTASSGSTHGNMVMLRPLGEGVPAASGTVRDIVSEFGARYSYVGNDGSVFYFRTDDGAPNGQLVAIDMAQQPFFPRHTVIAESDAALRQVTMVGSGDETRFVGVYLQDAASRVELFHVDGAAPARPAGQVELPGLGTASGFGRQGDLSTTFYSYQSYTTPPRIDRLDVTTGTSELFRAPDVAFDPERFETTRVFYTSKDGTRVPMFITHKQGLELDGGNPTLLYGYGGFNIPQVPRFSVKSLVWMELGGVYAAACLRGGGEYGEGWHEAGTRTRKQNVFDDCIAAAEWLVQRGYTSPDKLALHGRSNGGLLVGAVVNQRPDLFGAALPAVGVMDMLRFDEFTIGWAWVRDYGSPDVAEEFAALRAYSPYHNIRGGTDYPAVMVTTADHDDRVVPAHSYKYTAALQRAQAGDDPILIRIETRAGHGAGKPTSMKIDEAADMWSFLAHELEMEIDAPRP